MSLAICSSLLAAMGTAFVASSKSLTANDEFTRASSTARATVTRLEREIRRGVLDSSVVLDANGSSTSIRMISAEGSALNADRSYTYDATNKRILLVTNSVTSDADIVLANNVSAVRFYITKGTDALGAACVNQVGIVLTITVNKNTITLSGSASPRKSLAQ